jgi:hypothetical protein
MALVIMKPSEWKVNRVKFLQRILLTTHARLVNTPNSERLKYIIFFTRLIMKII